jgi:hypothetical protein
MPSSYTSGFDDKAFLDRLAQDNEQLAKENKRLNQIVDAFCIIAGASPADLPTMKQALGEAIEYALKNVEFVRPEHRF